MEILLKPIVTEKMTKQGEDHNRYGFVVHKKANKIEIKKAVEEMYGVTVASVNTMVYPGKAKSRYTKSGRSKELPQKHGQGTKNFRAIKTII